MQRTKEILRANDLRPTKQRVLIGNYLFDGVDKHVTAESLFKKLSNEQRGVSLATVYNTLHEFCKKELLNKITIDTDKVYFDTNISLHHHFFSDKEKILLDIKSQDVKISSMPNAPKGKKIKKVELIIHLED
ncbi:transcriptional repressor [Pelagibacteraceae bacterium]|nr:transcriptional repressor [Pelagibacteraceae bacterium]